MSKFGIVTHLIAPFSEFKLDTKPQAIVVGFSDKHAFLMEDQKTATTSRALRRKLSYSDDVCISYAEEVS
jgi:hypothetical protein